MNQNIKPYEHQNFLHGNPVTREKTTEASLCSKFTLPDSTLAGATTPYNLLEENTDSFYTILLPGTNRKGLQPLQAYWVGPSTTLPPCKNRKGKTQRERLKTDSVQALLTTVNVTVSKWETHFDWQTPQPKERLRRLKQDSIKQTKNKAKKANKSD